MQVLDIITKHNGLRMAEEDITIHNGDVFFPEFDASEFDITIGESGGVYE